MDNFMNNYLQLQYLYQLWVLYQTYLQSNSNSNSQNNQFFENSGVTSDQIQKEETKKPKLALSLQDLNIDINQPIKKPWTEQQDDLLRHLVQVEKKPWNELPNFIEDRNEKMCYSRYRRLSLEAKKYWKRAQDQKILQLVNIYGQSWRQISQHFQGRSAKQIRQHYLNFLRPDIRKDQWTQQQDMKIIQLINTYGKTWKQFQKMFNGRTQNQIKNRFYGRLKKIMMKKQKKRKYRY